MQKIVILVGVIMFSSGSYALSPEAEAGKGLFAVCNACHNQANDPPLGPPMWGVKRRYMKATNEDDAFVKRIVDFVQAPTIEKAIHDKALEAFGLMNPMPMPAAVLTKIATYILEEKFPPPCNHWQIAVKRSKAKGDIDHAKNDQMQFDRFCQ